MKINIKKIIALGVLFLTVLPRSLTLAAGTGLLPDLSGASAKPDIVLQTKLLVVSKQQANQPTVEISAGALCKVGVTKENNLVQEAADGAMLNQSASCFTLALGNVNKVADLTVKPLAQPKIRITIAQIPAAIQQLPAWQQSSREDSASLPATGTSFGFIKIGKPSLIVTPGLAAIPQPSEHKYALTIQQLQVMRC